MSLIELAKEKGLEPHKTSATGGGEYHCACPKCGGSDRFTLWPNKKAAKCIGRYWCRQCDIKGDTIQFCIDFLGLSYQNATKKLNIAPKEFVESNKIVKKQKQEFRIVNKPNKNWQDKANLFVMWCNEQLLKTSKAIDKLHIRGFSDESIHKFKLGYCPSDMWREYVDWGLAPEKKEDGNFKKLWLAQGLVIPWFDQDGNISKINVRRDDEKITKEQDQKYVKVKGSMECPVVYGDISLPACVILESEFDAILIQQFAGDLCFCIANSAGKSIDFYTDHLIRKTSLVLVCPDIDPAGSKSFKKLHEQYRNSILWPAPVGKSPGDALKDHKINLREWILLGLPESLKSQKP